MKMAAYVVDIFSALCIFILFYIWNYAQVHAPVRITSHVFGVFLGLMALWFFGTIWTVTRVSLHYKNIVRLYFLKNDEGDPNREVMGFVIVFGALLFIFIKQLMKFLIWGTWM